MTKLTWLGHACFLIEQGGYRAVIDPFAPGSVPGLPDVEVRANEVFCSHGHSDHSAVGQVSLVPGPARPFAVRTVASWHDDAGGTKRGDNLIHVFQSGEVTIVHLGDLGHTLSPEQAEAIGRPDVLLIPVGGFYTIDAAAAVEVVGQLAPRIVVPMHYRGANFGLEKVEGVEPFLDAVGHPLRRFEGSSMELGPDGERFAALLRSPVKE